ncbi:MAG: hypothetical protein WBA59_03975 [Moheibacter sp.]
MALTTNEIQDVLAGVIRPNKYTLFELFSLSAKRHSLWFFNNLKDVSGNPDAKAFQDKKENLARSIVANSGNLSAMLTVLMIKAGNIAVYATMKTYTDAQWENLIEDNISDTFFTICGATEAEKNAWDGLPVPVK